MTCKELLTELSDQLERGNGDMPVMVEGKEVFEVQVYRVSSQYSLHKTWIELAT